MVPDRLQVKADYFAHYIGWLDADPGAYDREKSYRLLADFWRGGSIAFVDLLLYFRRHHDVGECVYLDHDIHWDVKGRTAAVRAVVPVLEAMLSESVGAGAPLRSARRLPPRDTRWGLYLLAGLGLVQAGLFVVTGAQSWGWLPLAGAALVAVNLILVKRPFFPYDRILSAFSSDGFHWRREPGIRLDVGGLQRSCQVYSPCAVAAEGGWRMFYRGGGYDSRIFSAFSTDGLTWREELGERVGLGGGNARVDFPVVVPCGQGQWRMYYAATDGERWRIFCRESTDLLHWEGERIAIDMGAAADYPDAMDPTVIDVEGGWRMIFNASGTAGYCFYTAFSRDGADWQSPVPCRGLAADGAKLRNPSFFRLANGKLYLYFSEYAGSIVGSRIACAAAVDDGVKWQRQEGGGLSSGGPWGEHGVFCPAITPVPGGWRMYYGGYWGRHWCEWLTLYHHRRRARASDP